MASSTDCQTTDTLGVRKVNARGRPICDTVENQVTPITADSPEPDLERAERIRELKDQRGWSYQRLADEIGVSKPTAESWVYRQVKPNWPHLARLAEVFDVTDTIFLGDFES